MTDNITSAALESWRALAQQITPSSGAYSGGFQAPGSAAQQPNNAQWLRKISLIVYGGSGGQNGIELANLRVTFNLTKKTQQSPDLLDAKVYNMAPATMSKVIAFTRVQLSAGYQFANYGLLFDGQVVQYRRGKENPTDTYLEIIAGDGDAMNSASSFHSFPAGSKESDAMNQLISDTGLDKGHVSPMVGTDLFQRPWIVAGPTQQYLREITQKYGANFFCDKGKLNVLGGSELMPGEAVVLSPTTGLVGIPELTPQGVQARCLLNPQLTIGGQVTIDKNLISGIPYIPGGGGQEMTGWTSGESQARIGAPVTVPEITSPTGNYKIAMMEVVGDTRGQPWYCDMICLAMQSDGSVIGSTNQSAFNRMARPGEWGQP